MAVLPPLERTVLQSRESDADAEMSSSVSEEDALEYDMSEDLEDSPAVNSPPPSSKPQKGHSKFLVSSEPEVARDTISSSLKTSQHSNFESSLIHCSTASSSTFSEQSNWSLAVRVQYNMKG
ncbi:hypothetical protein AVEN_87090-1 [Araneus ventricosus]|uniref:Uncharacterized protein n=1 Tax=Araneus ventricosus TaxID=182803 RepID=A0A4Y2K0S9_ARAVE|nr:hypothetical protein AVEN_87090-1 [Araneus ventricosus]